MSSAEVGLGTRQMVEVVFWDMPQYQDMVLVVAFDNDPSDTTVTDYLTDILKRLNRQGVDIDPIKHWCTLHLDDQHGPVFDPQDLVNSVLFCTDKLVVVITENSD